MKKQKQYNHMMDVAFVVISKHEDYSKIKPEDMLEALQARVTYLRNNPDECAEAFGFCDTYEIE